MMANWRARSLAELRRSFANCRPTVTGSMRGKCLRQSYGSCIRCVYRSTRHFESSIAKRPGHCMRQSM